MVFKQIVFRHKSPHIILPNEIITRFCTFDSQLTSLLSDDLFLSIIIPFVCIAFLPFKSILFDFRIN